MNPIKPDHYKGNRFEAIDIIEDYELNFNLGSAIKYILRSGKKNDAIEDLEKAEWFIKREIDRLITARLESTDAIQTQQYHNSGERIAHMIAAEAQFEKTWGDSLREAIRSADEREMW